jgi:hypothetical protein
VQGHRPWRLAGLKAHDAVEPGLDERHLECLQASFWTSKGRTKLLTDPGIHLGHGVEWLFKRDNVAARLTSDPLPIAAGVGVIVQIALRDLPESRQAVRPQCFLKGGHRVGASLFRVSNAGSGRGNQ